MKDHFLAVMFCLATLAAAAQKLPNIQPAPIFAPSGLKIDGKDTEWGPSLQAYNKATDVFYTVANDNDNIYLVVQATKPRTIEKIISVGLTFTINLAGKKSADDKENMSVTYPAMDMASAQRILFYAGARSKSAYSASVRGDTTRYSETHTDSLVAIANHLYSINSKMIKIKGLKEITDPDISVYNEEKIKAIAAFSSAGVYTYELAVPLKYFGLNAGNPKQFSYSILLESRLTEPKKGLRTTFIYRDHQAIDVDQDLDSATDFWGQYMLVKK